MGKGFGRIEKRRQRLDQTKDKLIDLNEMIPWDIIRQTLAPLQSKERKSNAGRKGIDLIVLFKLLLLKQFYNLSNEETEYQAHDRISFRRFLGLDAARAPAAEWLRSQRGTNHRRHPAPRAHPT